MGNTINLLAPSTVIKKRNVSAFYGKLVAAGCVFAVLLTCAVYTGYFILNRQLNNQLKSVRTETKALDGNARQVAAAEALKTSYRQRMNDVNTLQVQKPLFSKYIDELLKITPVGVQITNLELSSNPFEATVQGAVDSHAAVAQFGRNLQRSKLYKDSMIDLGERRAGNDLTGNNLTEKNLTEKNLVGQKTVNFVISVTSEAKGDKR